MEPTPQVMRIAMTSKRNLKRINNPDDIMSMPYSLVATRQRYQHFCWELLMRTPILGSAYVARSVNAADNRMVNFSPKSSQKAARSLRSSSARPAWRGSRRLGQARSAVCGSLGG
jgi:hypothetical protein